MTKSIETTLQFDEIPLANQLFGAQGSHLALLTELTGLSVTSRGSSVTISGHREEVELSKNLLVQLYGLLKNGSPFASEDISRSLAMLRCNPSLQLAKLYAESSITTPKKSVTPKTLNQKAYVESLRAQDMTFGIGPAGTGKTYLAVAAALSMYSTKRVKRIILTRPAVEAGERLGFLPGDMAQKVDPYLRPLYDALYDMMDAERVTEMLENNSIEIAPLAFMRGRTLNNAFIILDEAQNTTMEQMKMFVTRLGFGSKMAITGDITQIDLPNNGKSTPSGLVQALRVLQGVEGISFIHFDQSDVVRHPLVGKIITAYDKQ